MPARYHPKTIIKKLREAKTSHDLKKIQKDINRLKRKLAKKSAKKLPQPQKKRKKTPLAKGDRQIPGQPNPYTGYAELPKQQQKIIQQAQKEFDKAYIRILKDLQRKRK